MECPVCHFDNAESARFCANCGNQLNPLVSENTSMEEAHEIKSGEAIRSYRFTNLYSGIFKRHSFDEAESLFTMGTPKTTPEILNLPELWPNPWLYARILAACLLLYLGFYMGLIYFENVNFLPGLIMVGAFLVPISILMFFWEINVPLNISLYRVVIFFFFGGLISLLYSLLLYSLIDGFGFPLLIGIVEETAKLLAILIFASQKRYNYILNGLLIGAAVGTGFAAFESSGYILVTALQYGTKTMLSTIFWRAILAPGGHIAWAGLTGAAVMMVKKDHQIKFRYLFKARFLTLFAFVIILHTLWDTSFPQPFLRNIPLYPIILTIVSWVALLWVIRKGIHEVSNQFLAETSDDNPA